MNSNYGSPIDYNISSVISNKNKNRDLLNRLHKARAENRESLYSFNRSQELQTSSLSFSDLKIRSVFIIFICLISLFYVFILDDISVTPFESGLTLARSFANYGADMRDSLVGSIGSLRNYMANMDLPPEDVSFGSGFVEFFEGLALPFVTVYAIFRLIITFALGNIKFILACLSILLGV